MFSSVLLQASGIPAPVMQIIFFGAIFLVFYFFFIRPQQKKQKDAQKFRESLRKGDQVVTIGGMHGKVFATEGDQVTLEVDKSVKLVFDKSAIARQLGDAVAKA